MAELVYALASGASGRKALGVRVPLSAQVNKKLAEGDSNGTFAPRLAGREQKSVAPEEKFESLQISGEEESPSQHK